MATTATGPTDLPATYLLYPTLALPSHSTKHFYHATYAVHVTEFFWYILPVRWSALVAVASNPYTSSLAQLLAESVQTPGELRRGGAELRILMHHGKRQVDQLVGQSGRVLTRHTRRPELG